MLSIIIPTYNEKDNVRKIVAEIDRALTGKELEIIFVDDSTDKTATEIAVLTLNNPNVRLIHRNQQRGLATAVAIGFQKARGELICVMDADLQHPPAVLIPMLAQIEAGADLVIPSRFLPGADDGGLSGLRKIVSRAARLIAWLCLRRSRLTTDPMSGFFMFQKKILQKDLAPLGWKILLEVLVKGNYDRVAEVPYRFQSRQAEASKMTWREQLNFLKHVARLVRSSSQDLMVWKRFLLGLAGVAINLVVFSLLLQQFGLTLITTGGLAALIALLPMPAILKRSGRKRRIPVRDWSVLYLISGMGIIINGMILEFLAGWGVNIYLAQLAGAGSAVCWSLFAGRRLGYTIRGSVPKEETLGEESLA